MPEAAPFQFLPVGTFPSGVRLRPLGVWVVAWYEMLRCTRAVRRNGYVADALLRFQQTAVDHLLVQNEKRNPRGREPSRMTYWGAGRNQLRRVFVPSLDQSSPRRRLNLDL